MWAWPVLHWMRRLKVLLSSVQNLSVRRRVGGSLFTRENLDWGGLGVFVQWCLHASSSSLFLRPAMYAWVLCPGLVGVSRTPDLPRSSAASLPMMPKCPGPQLIPILPFTFSFITFLIIFLHLLPWP